MPTEYSSLAMDDKQKMRRYLRETFNGVLPEESAVNYLKGTKTATNEKHSLGDDVSTYLNSLKSPASFVCPGGSEFQYENTMQPRPKNLPS
jgi:hypothetical protein